MKKWADLDQEERVAMMCQAHSLLGIDGEPTLEDAKEWARAAIMIEPEDRVLWLDPDRDLARVMATAVTLADKAEVRCLMCEREHGPDEPCLVAPVETAKPRLLARLAFCLPF